MSEKKTKCKKCGVEILLTTALSTNGYCMPHSYLGIQFKEKIGGIIASMHEVSPKGIYPVAVKLPEFGLETDWDQLIQQMVSGDKLLEFHTLPSSPEQSKYAATGYAIDRNGTWLDGIVTEWMDNKAYYEDIEEAIEIDTLSDENPEILSLFKGKLMKGDIIVHFRTSPMSWDSLCGREGFAIKRKGKYRDSVVTILN